MTDRAREEIVGYLLGALDDSEREALEVRLKTDPEYQRQWAIVRRQMGQLTPIVGQLADDVPPPAGLARRTCDFVFSHARRMQPARRRPMTPYAGLPGLGSSVHWLDVTVAAVVLVVAALAVLPAVQGSRFQARLAACQDNLRQLGVALTDYSRRNHDRFPEVPQQGSLAAAGIYAPILVREGFLTDSRRVICPESPQADDPDVRVPSIEELQVACNCEAQSLRQMMGGSYGYCLGHLENGVLAPTKNTARVHFAVMADAPSESLPGHQSLNHGGRGQNVLFEDGLVEFAVSSQPVAGADDIFANDDHIVDVGLHSDDSVIAPSGTAPRLYAHYQ